MDTPRTPNRRGHLATLLGASLFLAACGGGGSTPPAAGSGTLRLALVDAPACGYEQVHVTVQGVRVHQSAGAGDSDAGWVALALPTPLRLDLLTLTNGVLAELGQVALPAGRYTQLRLLLAPNTATTPLANAVTPVGDSERALDTPSATTSGLKLPVDIEVPAGQVADFLIDFDACRSVVARGNSGRYNLKPVLRVMPRLAAAGARIQGWVDPAMAGITVSAQQAGVPVVSTVPDPADGRFTLYPLPTGAYTVVFAGAGRATGVVTGVPVVAEAPTALNAASAPIMLPEGGPRTVEAGVTAVPEPESVLLEALQTLGDGSALQVLARPAPADGTRVALPLAGAPPQVAAYDAAAPAPAFAPDAGAGVAGRYTVRATVQPAAPAQPVAQTALVDVSATVPDPLPALDFVFP